MAAATEAVYCWDPHLLHISPGYPPNCPVGSPDCHRVSVDGVEVKGSSRSGVHLTEAQWGMTTSEDRA